MLGTIYVTTKGVALLPMNHMAYQLGQGGIEVWHRYHDFVNGEKTTFYPNKQMRIEAHIRGLLDEFQGER